MVQQTNKPQLTGLSAQEVLKNREKYGSNLLTPPKRPSIWKLYLEKFRDPVIQVLLVAAVFSLIISIIENEYAETIGIFFAIFLATGIGFYFEYDANKKFDLLNAVNEDTPVTVIRDNKIHEIPRKDVVVGDIVILNTGEEIPADGTLLEAISLQVNESSLTGELMVNKTTDEAHFDEEATYPSNAVMRGTTVTDGHGTMQVTRVGDATEIGKVARQSTEQSQEQSRIYHCRPHLYYFHNQRFICLSVCSHCNRLASMDGYCPHRIKVFHDGRHTYRRSSAGRPSDERHVKLGFKYAKDVENEQSCPKDARLRNNGCHYGHLHRQDRYANSELDASV